MEQQQNDNSHASAQSRAEGENFTACPCGQIPTELGIYDANQGSKWAMVGGSCCGEWMIEFRTNYADLDSEECKRLAREAWNDAPRAYNANITGG